MTQNCTFYCPTFARIVFRYEKNSLICGYNKVRSILSFRYVAEENFLKESLEMTSKQTILEVKFASVRRIIDCSS
jgi:hypothetical protein